MGLYKRDDLERDLMEIGSLRAKFHRHLLTKKIDGFKHVKAMQMLDAAEKQCQGKLVGTVLKILDREHANKNTVRVLQKPDGTMMRMSAGKWIETDDAELVRLENAGQTLIEVGKKMKTRALDIRPDELDTKPKWRKVPRDEARKLAQEKGQSVRYNEDGSAEVLVG